MNIGGQLFYCVIIVVGILVFYDLFCFLKLFVKVFILIKGQMM